MNIMALISALPGAAAQGLIWGIMAIGVYITFRTLDIADLTVDGTMCTGGAVCIMMMMNGHNVWVSMLAAFMQVCWQVLQPAFSYLYGNSGYPFRYSDPAGTLLSEPEDHGKGKPGTQC